MLSWQIVPAAFFDMISDPDRDAVTRVMLTMTKFDLAVLEQAYSGA